MESPTSNEQDLRNRIDREIDRLSQAYQNEKQSLRFIVGVVAAVVVAGSAFAVFLFGNNLTDVKNDMRETVAILVAQEISTSIKSEETIKELQGKLTSMLADYERYKEALDALSYASTLAGRATLDPHGIYLRLSDIRDRQSRSEDRDNDRATALSLLDDAIAAAVAGNTDPNTAFNTGIVASSLELEIQATKLITLAYWSKPSIEHEINLVSRQDIFGRKFEFVNGALVESQISEADVRVAAWQRALELMETTTGPAQVQVLSQAANMADRNRGSGYIPQMIHALTKNINDYPDQVTSYAYAILADLVSRNSQGDWRSQYIGHVATAIKLLERESPNANWYNSSIKNLENVAAGVEMSASIRKQLNYAGISDARIREALVSR